MNPYEVGIADSNTFRDHAGVGDARAALGHLAADRAQSIAEAMVDNERSVHASSPEGRIVNDERSVPIRATTSLARPERRHILAERLVATPTANTLVLPLLE